MILDLRGDEGPAAKKVRSNTLVASGTPTQGLTAATFSEGVEYLETGGNPPVKRTVTSRTLDTALNGGLGEIREAEFNGSVRSARWNDRRQCIDHALSDEDGTGRADRGGRRPLPRVVNDEIMVDAARVEMKIEGSKMKATGDAKTLVARSCSRPRPETKDARRTPGIMQQDRPVSGLSRELVYTGGTTRRPSSRAR